MDVAGNEEVDRTAKEAANDEERKAMKEMDPEGDLTCPWR
jgi:hypothetical protein